MSDHDAPDRLDLDPENDPLRDALDAMQDAWMNQDDRGSGEPFDFLKLHREATAAAEETIAAWAKRAARSDRVA